jgi:hypothetical protein
LPPTADGVTVADLLKQLGDIPPERVRLYPIPGNATEDAVIQVLDHEDRPCELVEGTLEENAMGLEESIIALFRRHVSHQFHAPTKVRVRQRGSRHLQTGFRSCPGPRRRLRFVGPLAWSQTAHRADFTEKQSLDGGSVLPGFVLPLEEVLRAGLP